MMLINLQAYITKHLVRKYLFDTRLNLINNIDKNLGLRDNVDTHVDQRNNANKQVRPNENVDKQRCKHISTSVNRDTVGKY